MRAAAASSAVGTARQALSPRACPSGAPGPDHVAVTTFPPGSLCQTSNLARGASAPSTRTGIGGPGGGEGAAQRCTSLRPEQDARHRPRSVHTPTAASGVAGPQEQAEASGGLLQPDPPPAPSPRTQKAASAGRVAPRRSVSWKCVRIHLLAALGATSTCSFVRVEPGCCAVALWP